MRIEVLGDDITYGGWVEDAGKIVKSALKSNTAKKVTRAILATAKSNMTQTQKAQFANVQTALGIQPVSLSNASPEVSAGGADKGSMTPYLIVGGVLLVGILFMVGTLRK